MDQSVFQTSLSSSPGLLKVSSVRCSALFIGLTGQQAHIQRQRDVYYALAQEHTCSSHTLSSGYTHTYTLTGWLREIYHMLEHTLTQCSEKSCDVDRSNLSPEESLSAGWTYSDLANNECSLSLGEKQCQSDLLSVCVSLNRLCSPSCSRGSVWDGVDQMSSVLLWPAADPLRTVRLNQTSPESRFTAGHDLDWILL